MISCDILYVVSRVGVIDISYCITVTLCCVITTNHVCLMTHYQSQLTVSYRRTVHLLLELLFVKFGYFLVTCLSK